MLAGLEIYDNFTQISIIKDLESAIKDQNTQEVKAIIKKCEIDNFTQIEIKELYELSLYNAARDIVKSSKSSKQAYNNLVELYNSQKTLSARSSNSMILQQYSTPIPISYLAGYYVKNNRTLGTYFEPSAGNGLLTVALNPDTVYVNEIDRLRLSNLKRIGYAKLTSKDATSKIYENNKFDGILTNPPFGSCKRTNIGGFEITALEHIMSIVALDTMQASGRAAIIVGGHTEYDAKGRLKNGKNRTYLNYLYSHYNVDDVINISGNLYRKQGTNISIRLILINGRKDQVKGIAPMKSDLDKVVTTFEELYTRVSQFVSEKESESKHLEDLKRRLALGIKLLDNANLGDVKTEAEFFNEYKAKVEEFVSNGYKLKNRKDFFSLGYPNDILERCGLAPNCEMIITQNCMLKILGQKKRRQDEAHSNSVSDVLKLFETIRKPVLVLYGNEGVKDINRKFNTRQIYLDIYSQYRNTFTVVDIVPISQHYGQKEKYLKIVSMYSQEKEKTVLKIEREDTCFYHDDKKIENLLTQSEELPLLLRVPKDSHCEDKDI